MMNDLFTDVGYVSLNHVGEELCGDNVEIVRKNDELVTVLADGLGSGVKACILSTLTSKIISTMISEEMSIDECVETIAATLPVCRDRGVAYSTFTIMRFTSGSETEIIQFDNPMVILLRDGKNFEYPVSEREIGGKKIFETRISLKNDDVFIAMSDGAVYAGAERVLNYGWQRENIIAYAEGAYDYRNTAKIIASNLADECNRLYDMKPTDDTTVLAVQIRKRKYCSVAFGPPEDPADDEKIMSEFLASPGRHIVCGGTTSKIAARYLKKEIVPKNQNDDPSIPPASFIDGIDLVTEGIITMAKVLDYANDYIGSNSMFKVWNRQNDAASELARMLLREATNIIIFAGRAKNTAHKNEAISFNIKLKVIEELKAVLEKMDKTVVVNYY